MGFFDKLFKSKARREREREEKALEAQSETLLIAAKLKDAVQEFEEKISELKVRKEAAREEAYKAYTIGNKSAVCKEFSNFLAIERLINEYHRMISFLGAFLRDVENNNTNLIKEVIDEETFDIYYRRHMSMKSEFESLAERGLLNATIFELETSKWVFYYVEYEVITKDPKFKERLEKIADGRERLRRILEETAEIEER